jgi:membrane protease YdiL (CAAX protease family)
MSADQAGAIANTPETTADPRAVREVLRVYVVVGAITWALSRLQSVAVLREHLHLVVGALFLLIALRCADRLPGGTARYGLALGGLLGDEPELAAPHAAAHDETSLLVELWTTLKRGVPKLLAEAGVAALVCALVFPPFVVGFYLWHNPTKSFVWLHDHDLLSYGLTQVLVIGLPEEALFRGYIQGRLADAWPRRRRCLGATLPVPAWLLQALLFAVLHVAVDYNPARLAVFFPALLFGWLRELRSGIGAAILVHAACNLLSDALIRGWL